MPTLASDAEVAVPAIAGAVFIIWIIAAYTRSAIVGRAREATKRDVAAFVAEGSIDPDKAVAILNANNPKENGED